MSKSRWIRLNIDWHTSDWLVVLSAESRLAWVQLLCHMKAQGYAGRCKAINPLVAERMWFVNEPSIRQMLQAAEQSGALIVADGAWEIPKWKEFQGDETNSKRQSEFKQRNKVTVGNGEVTEVTPTETETETETKEKINKKNFVPPTQGEVLEYANERGIVDNPGRESQRFVDYWTSIGWKRGRNSVKDWKATWRTWESNNQKDSNDGVKLRFGA